jgi:2-phospho-L-lactate guanylyltransferase
VTPPTWAVVPVKSLARGKSRLSGVLGDGERARFAQELAEHILGVLAGCRLDGVLVATDGREVAALAEAHGAGVLFDRGEGSLADVVDAALAEVARRGAGAGLVLMADLPRITVEDVGAVLAALPGRDVVVVPDHKGRHTNALALAPPTAMPTRFGRQDSFAAHCEEARVRGLRLGVLRQERIAFDVDLPDDHRRAVGGALG